ncbi:flagellar biosynthetic protein FliQ [Catenovulum sediminis]|uniref:flagellar biosynthetic protein FliQ n=1 Tax=Catenovulum sediminis TaxID=1740262 RepID=UPI00117EC0B2|nr:flagellar biosynthetic protein FliQ [Catenovulum sediminis]
MEVSLLFSKMLVLAAYVGAPVILTSLVVGLLISILQVVTQIQEMTLTFVPKLVAAVMVIILLGSWMLTSIGQFAKEVFILASGF